MTSNQQLHLVIVYCKNCIHRRTNNCPRYWTAWAIGGRFPMVNDRTTDYGFCEEGEGELE